MDWDFAESSDEDDHARIMAEGRQRYAGKRDGDGDDEGTGLGGVLSPRPSTIPSLKVGRNQIMHFKFR